MRTTLRMLARRPAFSLLAALTLALGITATTVVFSFAYGVLLSPLPYANARRLVLLWEYDRTARTDPGDQFGPVTTVPQQDFVAWRQQSRTLESLDALTFGFFNVTQGASPTQVLAGRVTPGFFHTAGVQPLLGRTLAPGDPDDTVVLGYSLWQTQFGGDRTIVGRQILLGDGRYNVVGVLRPEFFFYMREFALWTPLSLRPGAPRARPVMGVGLLREGASEAQAQAEMDTIASRLESRFPATNRNRGARVIGVRAQYSRFYRPTVVVLLVSVGFLLLIACANVASLLLARAAEREREMAIRAALGASRWRLVRQLLGESTALAVFAGCAGIAAAVVLLPLARTLLPLQLELPFPGVEAIGINVPVLLFSSAVSMLSVLLFGLAPALRAAGTSLGSRAGTAGIAQRRFLDGIVVAELALAVLLLTGAGLGLRSVYSLYHGTGFRADHILFFRTPTSGLASGPLTAFYREVLDRTRALPGVQSAAAAYSLPGGGNGGNALFAEGGSTDPREGVPAAANTVSDEFFGTLRIPLLAGRTFGPEDGPDASPVVILSASLARRLFGGVDAIGRRIRTGGTSPGPWMTVTGIAGDVRPLLAQNVQPTYYRPYAQDPPGAIGFLVRTAGEPLRLGSAVEKTVWQIRPGQPVTYLETIEDDLDQQGFRQRLSAIGLGWFAGFGLALAALGIYGLMAYVVKQRLREFGVRIAVGATGTDLAALVLRRGGTLVSIGLLLGIAGSVALTRILKSVLYGVQPVDAPAFAVAAVVLAAVALMACYLPARRAARVDPAAVLRSE